jgi:hypothetical protein
MSGAEDRADGEEDDTPVPAPAVAESPAAAPVLLGSVAVLDACVLYPASLRDLFVTLAVGGLYLPRWTDTIHTEWIENLLEQDAERNDPPRLERARLLRSRELMERACPRSRVTDYEPLIETLSLPDPYDRHVLAAAITCGASIIVTFNRRHFPASALAPHGIEALHPDAFLSALLAAAPERFRAAVQAILDRLKNPPRTWAEHVAVLRDNALPRLAARLAADESSEESE